MDDSMEAVVTFNNGYSRLHSGFCVHKVLITDSYNYLFNVGVGGYAQLKPTDLERTCDNSFIQSHGFSLDVSDASMYAPTTSDEILVAPGAEKSTEDSAITDIGFTALNTVIGLANPSAGAATAAGAIAKGVHSLGKMDDTDNYVEYMWANNNPSPSDFSAVAHYVDFWIESDADNHDGHYTFIAKLQHIASTERCLEGVEECYSSPTTSFAEASSEFEISGFGGEGDIGLTSMQKEKLSEEEVEKRNIPDELLDDGPFYKIDDGASITDI